MLKRTLIALIAAFGLSGAALAQDAGPGNPLTFVEAIFTLPTPEEALAELDKADATGEPVPEPEGPSIYSKSLQALLAVDAQRDMNYLDFDWIAGGQDIPEIKNLKVVLVRRNDSSAVVRVTFTNYGDRRERIVYLAIEDGRWVIEDVDLKRPEKTRLSRILTENRQD